MKPARSLMLTIDVAHPPMRMDELDIELSKAHRMVLADPGLRILKIIHGYGSTGTGGSMKEAVRNWGFRNRSKFKAVIEGEHYSLYDELVRQMRIQVSYQDSDLETGNPGITVIWVK